ncbi:hypothetical protein BGX24_003699 [Mortierella sp. AD032]|nr:hypothetical protein BGX24_003699 [Mortierella sp. AD032]
MSTATITNSLTLTVVVAMEPRTHAFRITVPTNESIDYLRYLIRNRIAPIYPRFKNRPGDCIALWKVALPNPPHVKTEEVGVVEMWNLESKVMLSADERVGATFVGVHYPIEGNIHVVVV